MSFPRYPNYKDSGVEWLGVVPAHWEVKKVKHLARSIEQGWSPQCEGFPAEGEGEWGVLKVGCVNGGTFDPVENKLLPPELEPIPALTIVCGDLLISRANTRELVGSAAVADRDYPSLMLCDKLYRVRFDPELCSSRFVCRYLRSTGVRGQIELGATGASASMVNIGQSAIMELVIATPSLAEQTAIAEFLDRETGKIDELVAEQRRLMELLKEKRQAVISHAVTHGLNPAAPLKPSGIEWLGDVPAHWQVMRLCLLADFESGMAHEPFVDDNGKYIYVSARFISTGGESRKFCTQNLSPAKKNDVLMVMSDLPNGRALAKAFFVCDDGPYAVNQRVAIIRATTANPRYLYYFLDRNPGFLMHDDGMNQTHLWNDLFTKFPTLVPPYAEQQQIAEFIDAQTAMFDTLTAEAQRAIDLLQERRTALISAAVTGQIDVLGVAA